MNQKRLWISTALIALLIGVSFMLSVPHTTRDTLPDATKDAPAPVPMVALKDTYKKGKHTLTGSLVAPNACASTTATASLSGDASTSPRIALALSLVLDTHICLQVPTPLIFSVTILAPSSLPIDVTVNGAVASTTAL